MLKLEELLRYISSFSREVGKDINLLKKGAYNFFQLQIDGVNKKQIKSKNNLNFKKGTGIGIFYSADGGVNVFTDFKDELTINTTSVARLMFEDHEAIKYDVNSEIWTAFDNHLKYEDTGGRITLDGSVQVTESLDAYSDINVTANKNSGVGSVDIDGTNVLSYNTNTDVVELADSLIEAKLETRSVSFHGTLTAQNYNTTNWQIRETEKGLEFLFKEVVKMRVNNHGIIQATNFSMDM